MTSKEILSQLQSLGQESYKKVLLKHNIVEPLYGVKIEELKKIAKKIKNGYALSLELYNSGVYDAMYLAGLIAEPEKMSTKDLQKWAKQANCAALRESTVAWVTAESKHGIEMALEWIKSGDDAIASIGWSTLGDIVSITDDSNLDIGLLGKLLKEIPQKIHKAGNRTRYTMNGFIIAVGAYIKDLNAQAKEVAQKVGKVDVFMGDTACKVPAALEYIAKVEGKNAVGKKRKSARCL